MLTSTTESQQQPNRPIQRASVQQQMCWETILTGQIVCVLVFIHTCMHAYTHTYIYLGTQAPNLCINVRDVKKKKKKKDANFENHR